MAHLHPWLTPHELLASSTLANSHGWAFFGSFFLDGSSYLGQVFSALARVTCLPYVPPAPYRYHTNTYDLVSWPKIIHSFTRNKAYFVQSNLNKYTCYISFLFFFFSKIVLMFVIRQANNREREGA